MRESRANCRHLGRTLATQGLPFFDATVDVQFLAPSGKRICRWGARCMSVELEARKAACSPGALV